MEMDACECGPELTSEDGRERSGINFRGSRSAPESRAGPSPNEPSFAHKDFRFNMMHHHFSRAAGPSTRYLGMSREGWGGERRAESEGRRLAEAPPEYLPPKKAPRDD